LHLFSDGRNLCKPGRRKLLRHSHFGDRTTDQAQRLQTVEGGNPGGMADATRDLAATGERAEPVQILRTPAFADQIQWRCRATAECTSGRDLADRTLAARQLSGPTTDDDRRVRRPNLAPRAMRIAGWPGRI